MTVDLHTDLLLSQRMTGNDVLICSKIKLYGEFLLPQHAKLIEKALKPSEIIECYVVI